MKTTKAILYAGVLCTLLTCCSAKKHSEERTESIAADSVAMSALVPSSAAEEKADYIDRKFIRTADVKFKVKDVAKATYVIESIVAKNDGFVTYTNLASNKSNTTTVQVSEDSSLESTFYNVENSITLRVPNTRLDTTLKEIADMITYLDYRTIKAEDVGLQFLSNKLAGQRIQKHEKRLVTIIDKQGKKLKETAQAEENLLAREEEADDVRLNTLSLDDQVNYSTVTLLIYQPETVVSELIPIEKHIKPYEPPFWLKLKDAVYFGWDILEALILFVAKLWGILILGLGVYLIFRFVNRAVKPIN